MRSCCWTVLAAVAYMALVGPASRGAKPEAKDSEAGFVSLFDGKSLDGWKDPANQYGVENGLLVCKPVGHGNMFTAKEYSDFVLRFDFKLTAGANNGVGIREPLEGDAAYQGMEIQILDDTDEKYAKLHEYQYCSSIYGVVAAKREHLNKLGEWNSEEITAKGRRVTIVLNGATVVDANLDEAAPEGKTIDGKAHPGLRNASGYIGLLGHSSRVDFRNLRLKDLAEK